LNIEEYCASWYLLALFAFAALASSQNLGGEGIGPFSDNFENGIFAFTLWSIFLEIVLAVFAAAELFVTKKTIVEALAIELQALGMSTSTSLGGSDSIPEEKRKGCHHRVYWRQIGQGSLASRHDLQSRSRGHLVNMLQSTYTLSGYFWHVVAQPTNWRMERGISIVSHIANWGLSACRMRTYWLRQRTRTDQKMAVGHGSGTYRSFGRRLSG
jgi:hypothetical protein